MEFWHALVVADIDKMKMMNVVRKTCTERRRMSLLKISRKYLEMI